MNYLVFVIIQRIVVFDFRPWNIHDEDAAATAALLRPLGLGAILSVQLVGVELTVS